MADAFFVVALDFGTAYSGYSFCVKSLTENIRSVFWGVEHGLRTLKTPTCILFNKNQEFMKFGYDAVMEYKRMNKSKAKENYFFENFKMELYNKKISRNLMISAKNGKPLSALNVFSESLRYMKDHALKTIKDHTAGKAFIASDITWVLTVPAIWDAPAKQFMREAAIQADLVSELNSEKLILALEPEAASVWCKQLPQEGFLAEGLSEGTLESSPGTQYIVTDCGGGTIDITVHEVLENESLKELHKASGGDMGGNTIDVKFKSILRDTFQPSVWDPYEKEYPAELQKMMYEFSVQKCSDEMDIYITCPFNLTKSVEKQGKDIEDLFKHTQGVLWSDGQIRITQSKMCSLYDESISRIVSSIEAILGTPEIHIDYILLVGGYASCKHLQRRVQEQFSSRCTVLCPIDSQIAIAKGAVLFGNDPKIIASRVSALTYGISTTVEFNALEHPEEKREVNKKGDYVYCSDVFHSFVEKGQSVGCNDVSEYVFWPINDDQTAMSFSFYSTENENVKYVDDVGVKKIGSFSVPMPNTSLGRKRSVQFNVKFGLTEMQATATDLSSNQAQSIRLDFLTE